MELFLMILKYVGTAISGAAGIWGTVSETHEEKTKKLTRWGKWALGLAIGGFVVALSSQIAEQIRDAQEQIVKDREHQEEVARLNEQLSLMKLTASSVDSQKTRFTTMRANCVFELSTIDPRCKQFAEELRQFALQPDRVKGFRFPGKNGGGRISTTLEALNSIPPEAMPSLGAVLPLLSQMTNARPLWMMSKDTLSPSVLTNASKDQTVRKKLDLRTVIASAQGGWNFGYSTTSDRVFIGSPEMNYSSFEKSGRVVGISDLGGGHLLLNLLFEQPPEPFASFAPLLQAAWIELRFGEFPVTFDEFKSYKVPFSIPGSATGQFLCFESVFPSGRAIADGTHQKPRPQ